MDTSELTSTGDDILLILVSWSVVCTSVVLLKYIFMTQLLNFTRQWLQYPGVKDEAWKGEILIYVRDFDISLFIQSILHCPDKEYYCEWKERISIKL